MTVRRRFWRRVKVVYGFEDPGKGSLVGSEGLALCERVGLDPTISGGEERARFAVLASTMFTA